MEEPLVPITPVDPVIKDPSPAIPVTPQSVGGLPPWLGDLLDDWWNAPNVGSPLVLDLDGNGIDLASVSSSGAVYWDIDVDGFAEASGWIAGSDGLLAIDLNGDGVINDHNELFGTDTIDGFTVLSAYDSNLDNVIDVNDTQFNDLLVWVDTNSNGVSENAELSSLSDLGISNINLSASIVDYEIEGNPVTHESTFTINGQTQTIVDAWFTYDNMNSVYVEDYTLDNAVFFLPSLRGFGDVKDLHIAMSLDQTLLAMVQDVSYTDSASLLDPIFNLQAKIEDILYRWAGVDAVDPASRGAYIDARKLEFLEKFFGDEYLQFGQHTDPQSIAAEALEDIFHSAMSTITIHLLAQSGNTPSFIIDDISYDLTTGALIGQTHEIDNFRFTETSISTKTSDDNDVYVLGATSNGLAFQEQTGGGFDQIWVNAASTDDVRYWVDLGGELYFKFGDSAFNQVFSMETILLMKE